MLEEKDKLLSPFLKGQIVHHPLPFGLRGTDGQGSILPGQAQGLWQGRERVYVGAVPSEISRRVKFSEEIEGVLSFTHGPRSAYLRLQPTP